MSFLNSKVQVSIGKIILGLIIVLTAICIVLVWWMTPSQNPADPVSKWFAVFTGILSGLLVMIGQHLIALKNDKDLDLFTKTRIKKVLLTRDDETFYRELIKKSSIRIDVLGVTASRFLNDFATAGHPNADKRVLLDALQKKVRVRILVAQKAHLSTDEDKRNFETVAARLPQLTREFPDVFEVRYYNHLPAHSIVVVDIECLLGPIFPGLPSKTTPAMHSECAGEFAGPYIRYFEQEWTSAVSLQ